MSKTQEQIGSHTTLISLAMEPDCELDECSDAQRAAAARVLIANGADLNSRAHYGGCYTALHFALIRNRPALARVLIDSGADTNERGYDGESPLTVAVMRGYADIVDLFIARGANVNADVDTSNHEYQVFSSLLSVAIRAKNFEIVKKLIAAGAVVDLDKLSDELHESDYKLSLDIVKMLADAGASVDVEEFAAQEADRKREMEAYCEDDDDSIFANNMWSRKPNI